MDPCQPRATLIDTLPGQSTGQESRESLATLREAIPRNWAAPADLTAQPGAANSTNNAFGAAAPLRRVLLQYRPQVLQWSKCLLIV